MTAEIAILNSSGVALAADSAVTIGGQKVYNTANKLFMLSKYSPVGIMVYDSADLMSIPWETIIKEIRGRLGDAVFDRLNDYSDFFWGEIQKNIDLIPEQTEAKYIKDQAYVYFDVLANVLEKRTQERFSNKDPVTIETTIDDFMGIISEELNAINGLNYLPEFSDVDVHELVSGFESDIDFVAGSSKVGQLLELMEPSIKNTLAKMVVSLCLKDHFGFLRKSGVVIAGYGAKDIFPRIASFQVEGAVKGRVKKKFMELKSNVQNPGFVAAIIPFAQDEMVWTFVQGVDPQFAELARRLLQEIFNKYPTSLDDLKDDLAPEILGKMKERLSLDAERLFNEFQQEMTNFQRSNNIDPILNMIAVLPKDELAAVAEALVNLTVFKRRVSNSIETVGGPIDVAVISKGDGFIWVKRKHYFSPELNQHFFSNYFRQREV